MSILREELITNHLLLDYFDLWDEFDIKSANDTREVRYYNQLMNLINGQLDAGIRWLDSDEAEQYFKGESKYQREVFQALEDEWDEILSSKYSSVDALLSEVYRRGKAKGYADMRSRIRYTEQDKLALAFAREYNFGLIQIYDDDVRNQIKNKITEAIVAGNHPNTLAPKILSIAEERLDGSNFTPKQRATMIARTEVSRVQNTGILQSYVNEGYTEVKILTAEDNHVCDLCLRYAFEFNDDDITFENRGKERTHSIFKLIKTGLYPPFHPVCRCTYLSVWNSKGMSDNAHCIRLVDSSLLNNSFNKLKEIRNRKEKHINSPEKTAEYFGLTYDGTNIKFHQFIDEENGCVIFIEKDIAEGSNPLISMNNTGKAKINVIELIRTYAEAPDYLKLANDNIIFQNSGGNGNKPGHWDIIKGESTVFIHSKIALGLNLSEDYAIQRVILHEMGHGVDLDVDDGLHLSQDVFLRQLIKSYRFSSYYARTRDDADSRYSEEIAEAISMVAYKNKSDKSTAKISVPVYDENKKLIDYEVLDYWEWHERYNEIATYLENTLNI